MDIFHESRFNAGFEELIGFVLAHEGSTKTDPLVKVNFWNPFHNFVQGK